MSDERRELRNIVEAALFVAESPLSVKRIQALFPEEAQPARDEVLAVLHDLMEQCGERGIELREIDGGWRFQTRDRYSPWLNRMFEKRPPRYSRAMLETLAIIAYRQPVTRGDIEEIRGVSVSSDIMRTLQERDWIREVGTRDVPGRPTLYATTRGFLEYFNLRSLAELPDLAEQRDIDEIAREMNYTLPFPTMEGAGEVEAAGVDGESGSPDGAADESGESGLETVADSEEVPVAAESDQDSVGQDASGHDDDSSDSGEADRITGSADPDEETAVPESGAPRSQPALRVVAGTAVAGDESGELRGGSRPGSPWEEAGAPAGTPDDERDPVADPGDQDDGTQDAGAGQDAAPRRNDQAAPAEDPDRYGGDVASGPEALEADTAEADDGPEQAGPGEPVREPTPAADATPDDGAEDDAGAGSETGGGDEGETEAREDDAGDIGERRDSGPGGT